MGQILNAVLTLILGVLTVMMCWTVGSREPEPPTPLEQAVEAGDEAEVARCIERGKKASVSTITWLQLLIASA